MAVFSDIDSCALQFLSQHKSDRGNELHTQTYFHYSSMFDIGDDKKTCSYCRKVMTVQASYDHTAYILARLTLLELATMRFIEGEWCVMLL